MEILYPSSMALAFGIAALLMYATSILPVVWISLHEIVNSKNKTTKIEALIPYTIGGTGIFIIGHLAGYIMALFYNWIFVF